uniref:Ubiquitin carboxyl-terminal hydrolase 7 n=1 Tax=Ascaris suum TaxID=6253 RepID=F1KSM5_ASCSU
MMVRGAGVANNGQPNGGRILQTLVVKGCGQRNQKVNAGCQTDHDNQRPCVFSPQQPDSDNKVSDATDEVNMATKSYCEGLLSLTLADFVVLNKPIKGPCEQIGGFSWRIMAMPKTPSRGKKASTKCLGFFVECCKHLHSETWSCKASAELRLKSQKKGVEDFVRRIDHVYTARENDWGYSSYATWDEITDESSGYVNNGVVMLEALVKVELPKNLPPDQLKKKVKDYMAIAEMQCERGLIDKAIEMNTAAVNFCKNNRVCCFNEALHLQKHKLIDAKLRERIEAIEKGHQDEENTVDRNALKRAISELTKDAKHSRHPNFNCCGTTLQEVKLGELCESETMRIKRSFHYSMCHQGRTPLSDCNKGDSNALEQDKNTDATKLGDAGNSRKLLMGTKTTTLLPEHPQPPSSCLASNPERTHSSDVVEKRLLEKFADKRDAKSGEGTGILSSNCGSQRSCTLSTMDHSCQTVECLPVATGCRQCPETEQCEVMVLRHLERRETMTQKVAASVSSVERSIKDHAGVIGSVFGLFDTVKERCNSDELNKTLVRLAEGIASAMATEVPGAKGVTRKDDRSKSEVLISCLEDPDIRERLKEISGVLRTPKEIPPCEIIICCALRKGVVIEPADVKKVIEHIDHAAIRIGKQKKENEDLAKQLEVFRRATSRSTNEHDSWMERLEAEKHSCEEMAKTIRLLSNEHDELKKSVGQQMREAQRRRRLQDKVDSLKKKIRDTEKKCASELAKLRKDLLMSKEAEKKAVEESRGEEAQLVATKKQLRESSLQLERLKGALNARTMDFNDKVMLVTECARKAEVRLLQLKLEIGLGILKNAHEDSQRKIDEFELGRKRMGGGRYCEIVERSIAAWHDRRRLITELIHSAENDFAIQIDQVKGGKQLANLPTISVPMPPPAPESFRFDETYMQIPSTSGCHSSFAINGSPYWDAQEMGDVGNYVAVASSSANDESMSGSATVPSASPCPMSWVPSWDDWFNVGRSGGLMNPNALAIANLLAHSWAPQPSAKWDDMWPYSNGWNSGNDIRSSQHAADINSGSAPGRYAGEYLMQQASNCQQRERWNADSEHQPDRSSVNEGCGDNKVSAPSRHGDDIIRHLRMHFPALSCEKIMEYLKELMIRNGLASLDGMSVRDVVTGVAYLIVEKHG